MAQKENSSGFEMVHCFEENDEISVCFFAVSVEVVSHRVGEFVNIGDIWRFGKLENRDSGVHKICCSLLWRRGLEGGPRTCPLVSDKFTIDLWGFLRLAGSPR